MIRVLAAAASLALGALAGPACGGKLNSYVEGTSVKGYDVPTPVGRIVIDDAAFQKFSRQLRPDLFARAGAKDPEVAKAALLLLAMLSALDGSWDDAIRQLDRATALEPSAEGKAMLGLTVRVWADARGGDAEAFRTAFEARLSALPLARLVDDMAVLRAMGQNFTPAFCRTLVEQEVGPHVVDNRVTMNEAYAIVFQRYAVEKLVPVGRIIDEVLGKHQLGAAAPLPPAP